MAISVSDVRETQGTDWQNFSDSEIQTWIDVADRLISNQFSDRITTLPNFEGNRDDGQRLLTAHFLELIEGGESSSDSQSGGSVNFNQANPNVMDGLTETRYGRQFRDFYLRSEGMAMVRTR